MSGASAVTRLRLTNSHSRPGTDLRVFAHQAVGHASAKTRIAVHGVIRVARLTLRRRGQFSVGANRLVKEWAHGSQFDFISSEGVINIPRDLEVLRAPELPGVANSGRLPPSARMLYL